MDIYLPATHIRNAASKTDDIVQKLRREVTYSAQKGAKVHIECGGVIGQLFAHYVTIHLQGHIVLETLHGHIVPLEVIELLLLGRTQLQVEEEEDENMISVFCGSCTQPAPLTCTTSRSIL